MAASACMYARIVVCSIMSVYLNAVIHPEPPSLHIPSLFPSCIKAM